VKSVLIVEDSSAGRDIYAAALEARGYRVAQAADGAEGVRVATGDPPDLVIMNLSIPLVNGTDAIEILKAHPATEHIPVLVVSGHTHPGLREGAWQAGCDDFFTKPFAPSDLLAAVAECIGLPE
jgi:CheY-like chemotaxis protein